MSLSSLIADKNSWLWDAFNKLNLADIELTCEQINTLLGQRKIKPSYNNKDGALTRCLSYALAARIDPSFKWAYESPIFRLSGVMVSHARDLWEAGELSRSCAFMDVVESSGRSGVKPGSAVLPSIELMRDLDAIIPWIAAGGQFPDLTNLRMNVAFDYSEALGGADARLASQNTLIAVRTAWKGMDVDFFLKWLTYSVLDHDRKYDKVIFVWPLHQSIMVQDTFQMWKLAGDADKFVEVIKDMDEELTMQAAEDAIFGDVWGDS